MEKLLLNRIKNYTEQINLLYKKIKQYDRIAIFRHDHPDYDALGSQMAFVSFIKDNFKDKEVIFTGDDHVTLTGKCFPKMMKVKDAWFEKPFLAIVLDLSTSEMLADNRALKAEYIFKIDHHPNVDEYATEQIVDPTMIAAGELLACIFLFKEKYIISKETAKNLFKAIVGDSGRFLYSDTSELTFFIAQKLLSTGFVLKDAYKEMYEEKVTDLEVRKFILQNYKITKHGIAYYILTDKELKKFNLLPIQGKDNVNLFAHFKGINAWLSCTEDKEKGNWRVSLRSADKSIESIAAKYNGGGHANASGCKIASLKVLNKLIKDLDNLFK